MLYLINMNAYRLHHIIRFEFMKSLFLYNFIEFQIPSFKNENNDDNAILAQIPVLFVFGFSLLKMLSENKYAPISMDWWQSQWNSEEGD